MAAKFFLILLMCSSLTLSGGCSPREGTLHKEDVMTFDATVRKIELEGGFYGLISDAGVKYLPLDLPKAYKSDGLRVTVKARHVEEIPTIYMWGRQIKVLEIKEL
jgi:hypothetical protein